MFEYLFILVQSKIRMRHVLLMLCFGTIFVWLLLFKANPQAVVSFLDVGQGDAAFIQLATGEQILIDTGPGIEIMYHLAELMPRLDFTIEAVFISHTHADHVGGLEYIRSLYDVGNIFINTCPNGESLEYIDSFGDSVVNIYQNSQYVGDGIFMQSLWPPVDICEMSGVDENYRSQILEARVGNTTFLFTGDAEFGQDAPIDYGITLPIIDILKVPHHGSRHAITAEFLSKTSPSVAILSVGENSYGHPARDVLDLLQGQSVTTYRTDEHGTVHVVLSDDGYTILHSK